MAFEKGHPRHPRAGRPKGSTSFDKLNVKRMVLGALKDAGGRKWLAEQAKAHPVSFMTLAGKLLPIEQQLSGKDGASQIVVKWLQETPKPSKE